jgi:hypothetical protein
MNKRPKTETDTCDTKWSTEGTGNLIWYILGQLQFSLQRVFIQSFYRND